MVSLCHESVLVDNNFMLKKRQFILPIIDFFQSYLAILVTKKKSNLVILVTLIRFFEFSYLSYDKWLKFEFSSPPAHSMTFSVDFLR